MRGFSTFKFKGITLKNITLNRLALAAASMGVLTLYGCGGGGGGPYEHTNAPIFCCVK